MEITRKEFEKTYVPKKVRDQITICVILAYISAGANLIIAFIFNPLMMIDVMLLAGVAVGIHIFKSRACSITLFAYYIITRLFTLIGGGYFSTSRTVWSMIIWVPVYFLCVTSTFEYQKIKQNYLQNPELVFPVDQPLSSIFNQNGAMQSSNQPSNPSYSQPLNNSYTQQNTFGQPQSDGFGQPSYNNFNQAQTVYHTIPEPEKKDLTAPVTSSETKTQSYEMDSI